MQVWLVLPALHGETLSDIFSTFNIDFTKVALDGNLLIFRVPIPWCNANKARHSVVLAQTRLRPCKLHFFRVFSSLSFSFRLPFYPNLIVPLASKQSLDSSNSRSICKNCYFLQWKLTSEIASELRRTWMALVDQLLRNVARRAETETAGIGLQCSRCVPGWIVLSRSNNRSHGALAGFRNDFTTRFRRNTASIKD